MKPNRRYALGAMAAITGLAASPHAKAQNPVQGLSSFAVNLDTWFKQVPFEQRFALAKQHGFKFIEFWTVDRGNGTKASAIRALCDANGLSITAIRPGLAQFRRSGQASRN